MYSTSSLCCATLLLLISAVDSRRLVLNTWPFTTATKAAWSALYDRGSTALDAVQAGCTECEIHPCAPSVGFGGSPDEQGNTTLDALIMDGVTHRAGAVASMRRIKNAIGVARAVLDYTKHTMLVGESATMFAVEMGFQEENLNTNESIMEWKVWKAGNCAPNFRQNVVPDPSNSCGPYRPKPSKSEVECDDSYCDSAKHSNPLRYVEEEPVKEKPVETDANIAASSNNNRANEMKAGKFPARYSHDTIGMIAQDSAGNLAVGTSTNGATWKVPGRVGDSALVGVGAYVENGVGAAVGTGDGDTLMRFAPTFLVVELMRAGYDPEKACKAALQRVISYEPNASGALLAYSQALDRYGAACVGFEVEWNRQFPFAVRDDSMADVQVFNVTCFA